MIDLIFILSLMGIILFKIVYIPTIWRVWKRKKSNDVSIISFIFLLMADSLFAIVTFMTGAYFLIFLNYLFGIILDITSIIIIWYYRVKE